ncbi:MAG: hypothetical protein V1761_05035 [bacterium]
MKKLTIVLVSIIAVMTVAILIILDKSLDITSPRLTLVEESVEDREYTIDVIRNGTLRDMYEDAGTVVSADNELLTFVYPVVGLSYSIDVVEGQKFTETTRLAVVGSVPQLAGTAGKVIRIDETDEELVIYYIDYTHHTVRTTIPQELEGFITGATVAEVYYGGITYPATVVAIGYEVVDGLVAIDLAVPGLTLLPGSFVVTGLELAAYTNVTYVPSAFVVNDLGTQYVYLLDPATDTVAKVYVTVQQTLQSYTIVTVGLQYVGRTIVKYND